MRMVPGRQLVATLLSSPPWEHASDDGGLIETHLSWILLAGEFAYKINKPVDFGFVDFTTLERRRHFLEEELRLNRRFSDGWYLKVVPFYGDPDHPTLAYDRAPPFEYALQMRRFPQSALLSSASSYSLAPEIFERLADRIAAFHLDPSIAVADADTPYGSPETVWSVIEANFTHSRRLVSDPSLFERLGALEEEETQRFATRRGLVGRRKAEGHVRELHGDLHRGNIAIVENDFLLFDALEFNPTFRWIDPIAEIAFLVMDFCAVDMVETGRILLNRYLEQTGDYAGVPLLPLYLRYFAMVRAKIALLSRPDGEPDDGPCMARFIRYLSLAERLGSPTAAPKLIMTHGLSGSGKSRFTHRLIAAMHGIRVRSDQERRRLFPDRENRYSDEASGAVYARLRASAEHILEGGYHAVIDAAFLSAQERQRVVEQCEARGTETIILDFPDPDEGELPQRLARREADDPSEATVEVVARQRETRDPLSERERLITYPVDPTTTAEAFLATRLLC